MNSENTSVQDAAASTQDFLEEEIESIGDHHRMAAHHFAAAAADSNDEETNARHAHLAYRHRLNGVQYAEIAVMDNESLEGEFEDEVPAA